MAIAPDSVIRSKRFRLSATLREESLIRVAAERRGVNVARFIIDSACEKAEAALSESANFVASPPQWDAFMAALDAPPRVIPQVQKLFSEPPAAESR